MKFEVAVHNRVRKRLRKIPLKHQKQVLACIAKLDNNPRPHDSIKLKSDRYDFRVDVGEYRILYDVDYEARLIQVRLLMHRGEGYSRHLKL